MSRFRKLSQAIWHRQYHIVWTSKYRYRVVTGDIAEDINNCLMAFSEQLRCEIVQRSVRLDHVHLVVMIPPKVSVSELRWSSKGTDSNQGVKQIPPPQRKALWGQSLLVEELLR